MPELYVVPGHPCPNGPSDTDIVIYGYVPSTALAVVGTVIFGLYAVFAFWLMVRPRRAGAILIIFGVMFEAVGFIMRALSSQVRWLASLGVPHYLRVVA